MTLRWISVPESWFCSYSQASLREQERCEVKGSRLREDVGPDYRRPGSTLGAASLLLRAGSERRWMTDGLSSEPPLRWVQLQETTLSTARFRSTERCQAQQCCAENGSGGQATLPRVSSVPNRRSGPAGGSDKHLPHGREGKTGNQRTNCSDEHPDRPAGEGRIIPDIREQD